MTPHLYCIHTLFTLCCATDLRPWLIEVNHSPSFNIDSPLDLAIKEELINDTIQLVRIDPKLISKARKAEKKTTAGRLMEPSPQKKKEAEQSEAAAAAAAVAGAGGGVGGAGGQGTAAAASVAATSKPSLKLFAEEVETQR